MDGVIKVKELATGAEKYAVYSYSSRYDKLVYHVDSVPYTDKKFYKTFEIVRESATTKTEE